MNDDTTLRTPPSSTAENPGPPPDATAELSVAGRIWSLRTVAAAAITAVALSGAGGAALAAASDGGTSGGPGGRGGFGGPPGRMGGQFPGQLPGQAPGQQNGQTQPGQVPSGTGLTSRVSRTDQPPIGPRRPQLRGIPGQLPPATVRDSQDT